MREEGFDAEQIMIVLRAASASSSDLQVPSVPMRGLPDRNVPSAGDPVTERLLHPLRGKALRLRPRLCPQARRSAALSPIRRRFFQ